MPLDECAPHCTWDASKSLFYFWSANNLYACKKKFISISEIVLDFSLLYFYIIVWSSIVLVNVIYACVSFTCLFVFLPFSTVFVCVSQPCIIVWIGYILFESAFDAAACIWHSFLCCLSFCLFLWSLSVFLNYL